ncbi:MAG: L-histidine N(alpha)-methyltransferase [Gammaproteobacteria bacterium]|nr:L-histidine N(alpha)-methyltransferase [Gammaproteobacteria bacterium]MYF52635.1 L-histidine N(alpha)-methyltransferase [Gammaproteobacteria bacterium]MYK42593.1 L-histidine N(alpha)-methyltransferase [Gammaproteobacteria bacterium]
MDMSKRVSEYEFFDQKFGMEGILDWIQEGLYAKPKRLPTQLLFDKRGAQLYETITQLPENSLAGIENGILRSNRPKLSQFAESRSVLIKFGRGNLTKTRILLDTFEPQSYIPCDYACEPLVEYAQGLFNRYMNVNVYPVCIDNFTNFRIPTGLVADERVIVFLGSDLGIFSYNQAVSFLRGLIETIGDGGIALIGADLRQDPPAIHKTYNDLRGVAARFNLNILEHVNRMTGANFDLAQFRHQATYDEKLQRVELSLVCIAKHVVSIGGEELVLENDEQIVTADYYTFTDNEMTSLASSTGWDTIHTWKDSKDRFCVQVLQRNDANLMTLDKPT